MDCKIVEVGKRRDGGHRYWCVAHRANATAKYGLPADQCVASADAAITPGESRDLDMSAFPGGAALWGAVPPAYDTTRRPVDRGIHVHARMRPGAGKFIDETYRRLSVHVPGDLFSEGYVELDELDAINFMVSRVFGFEPVSVVCTLCGFPHLDRDWFAVHPHRRHLCHGCGRQFSDTRHGIGNPLCAVRDQLQVKARVPAPAPQAIAIRQVDYPGGIQLWGSNPAIVWTAEKDEREGIHLHGFESDEQEMPALDGTFREVTIDGVLLDPIMLRYYMAQRALPHIDKRVVALSCPACGQPHFDGNEGAYSPHLDHECASCNAVFRASGKLKKTIGNPFVAVRATLARHAVRAVRNDSLGLRPETI